MSHVNGTEWVKKGIFGVILESGEGEGEDGRLAATTKGYVGTYLTTQKKKISRHSY